MTVSIDAGRNDSHDVHHASTFSTTLGDRIEPDEGVRAVIQRAMTEALHDRIEVLRQLRDLALAHPFQPQHLDQAVHPSRRYTAHVALRHHLHQRSLGTTSRLQQPLREVRSFAKLGDR